MKYLTYTFRAYPNKTQEKLLYLIFTMCRLMFNKLLRLFLDNYDLFYKESEECFKNNTCVDQKKFNLDHKLPTIATLKKADDRYKQVDSLAICAEYKNLMRGVQMFFSGANPRLPHFKSRKDKNSYTTSCVNDNIRFEGKKVRLPKVGFVRIRGIRQVPEHSKIKQARVVEDKTGRFFISIVFEIDDTLSYNTTINTISNINNDNNCDNNVDINNSDDTNNTNTNNDNNNVESKNIVGLDFKIGDIFVSSDNFIPKYSNRYFSLLDKIPFIQKNVNRKCEFSKNYWRATNKLRRFHRNIVNIRKNMQHQVSRKLANLYDVAVIEDLSIKEIVYKLGRGKNAYNTSFNAFVKKLGYKLNIIKIDKWFPSSKKCCKCGMKKKHLKLSQRVYRCAFCSNVIDRDLNAAINIRNEGMRILRLI